MALHIPKKALMLGAAKLKPQDVFKTNLRTGNSGTQKITTTFAPDLVWNKGRTISAAPGHAFIDRLRGRSKILFSDSTAAEVTAGSTDDLVSFDVDGFTLGPSANTYINNPSTQVDWIFARKAKFFDIVTYTGNGVAGRQIAHNLGVVPGMIIVKARSVTNPWVVGHRGLSTDAYMQLQATSGQVVDASILPTAGTTSTYFTVGSVSSLNGNGNTYVAYIFAQNPDLIDCGSWTQGSGDTFVPCGNGWEPQFSILKNASAAGPWIMYDIDRGFSSAGNAFLRANGSEAEIANPGSTYPVAGGFMAKTGAFGIGQNIVHLSIRKSY